MGKKYYIKVTTDEYELPLAVAESARELAIMCHTTENAVLSSISKKRAGWIRIRGGGRCTGSVRRCLRDSRGSCLYS